MTVGWRAGARFLVIALSCAAAVGASTLTASAADNTSKCDAKHFCLFQNENYGPLRFNATGPAPGTTRVFPDLGVLDDNTKSMINNTDYYVVLYANHGCSGDTYVARPHSVDTTFANNHFNKRTSCVVINP